MATLILPILASHNLLETFGIKQQQATAWQKRSCRKVQVLAHCQHRTAARKHKYCHHHILLEHITIYSLHYFYHIPHCYLNMSIFSPSPETIASLKAWAERFDARTSDATTTSTSSKPTVTVFDPKQHSHLLTSFVDIHIACILNDSLVATFMPPFSAEKRETMSKWWSARFDEVSQGRRMIFISMASGGHADLMPAPRTPHDLYESPAIVSGTASHDEQVLAGYVSLDMPFSETGPFRGPIEKLLVNPRYRRRGIARMMMDLLEVEAKKAGRPLLVSIACQPCNHSADIQKLLDTITDSPAVAVYRKLGYTQFGDSIPDYGFNPDGSFCGMTYFYKDLRKTQERS
jgi:GNAT superfamily N-acetyltransferase